MNVLAFSDTHGYHEKIWNNTLNWIDVNDFDTVIHSGDISSFGRSSEVDSFINWFGNLPFKNKVFILGNHEVEVERNNLEGEIREMVKAYEGLHFLHHESVEIDGIKIFGSPYTPYFRGWAYNVNRKNLYDYWQEIPLDTDILVTHGPPFGIGDSVGWQGRQRCGDVELLKRLLEINELAPTQEMIHQFGHIHGSKGSYSMQDIYYLSFVNASCLTDAYDIYEKPYETYVVSKEPSE